MPKRRRGGAPHRGWGWHVNNAEVKLQALSLHSSLLVGLAEGDGGLWGTTVERGLSSPPNMQTQFPYRDVLGSKITTT